MENFSDYLKRYNTEIDPIINESFADIKQHAARYEDVTGKLVDDYRQFMGRGKRLRGSLVVLGYEMFGGANKKEILKASFAMEIAQSALLIHDDVMDQDDLRRGSPTMHKEYAKEHGARYGESMAMSMGDIGFFLAMDYLTACNFPPERLLKATNYLSRKLQQVGFGQALDITYQELKRYGQEEVLLVHRLKTAEYTIACPLTIGAILAGASDPHLAAIEAFGTPVGVAFQLRDDELGLYSTEAALGKPIGSDIRGSKVTLLISKARELAKSAEEKEFLESVYGHQGITDADVERVKTIIKKSGALEYSQNLSSELVEAGKQYISEITGNPDYQKYLEELADLGIERVS